MPSANVTLAGSGNGGFLCDDTQRTATLNLFGGNVSNIGSKTAFLNVDGGTVVTTSPVGAGGREVPVGATVPLPKGCRNFTFQCASGESTTLVYDAP